MTQEAQDVTSHYDDAADTDPTFTEWSSTLSNSSKLFIPHPVPVCESAALACVQPLLHVNIPPLQAGANVNVNTSLSTLQKQTVEQCLSSFHQYRGFFLGDGTGVGKGRTIAGVINAMPRGSRALWITPQPSLRVDAQRDLDAVCPGIKIAPLAKIVKATSPRKRVKIDHSQNEVSSSVTQVCHVTYACLRSKKNDALSTLFEWLPNDNTTVIVFDEAHNASNPHTECFQSCNQLQLKLPLANVIYSTATMASEVENLALMTRLPLFGPRRAFYSHEEMAERLRKYGASALELVAVELKQQGVYVSRQLRQDGVVHRTEVVALTPSQRRLYDAAADRWDTNRGAFTGNGVAFQTGSRNFFHSLLTSFKVDTVAAMTRKALSENMSVVIAIQNTGEASHNRQRCLASTVASPPTSMCREIMHSHGLPYVDLDLPEWNPLDRLIDLLGEENVAEITGRSSRGVSNGKRKGVLSVKDEIAAFQKEDKRICIISKAGSTGISLHAVNSTSTTEGGRAVISGRRRLHIVLETPWSSRVFLQQCGRTHRAGQAHPPEYVTVVTDVPSELRSTMKLGRRLQDMAALTHGERTSNNAMLSSPMNIDSKTMYMTALQYEFQRLHALLGEPQLEHLSIAALTRARCRWLRGLKVIKTVTSRHLAYNARETNEGRCITKLVDNIVNMADYINTEFDLQHTNLDMDSINTNSNSVCNPTHTPTLTWNQKRCFREGVELLECVLSMYPHANRWMPNRWSRNIHKWYHPAQQESAIVVLMMAARPNTAFSRLPKEVVERVISWTMRHQDLKIVNNNNKQDEGNSHLFTGSRLARHICGKLTSMNPNQFLNHTVLYPLSVQEKIYFDLEGYQYQHQKQQPVSSRGIVTLREFILGKKESKNSYWEMHTNIVALTHADENKSEGRVKHQHNSTNHSNDRVFMFKVEVRYNPPSTLCTLISPLENTMDETNSSQSSIFVQRGAVLYQVMRERNEVQLWRAGSERAAFRFDSNIWDAHISSLYSTVSNDVAIARWKQASDKITYRRTEEAQRMSAAVVVATSNFFDHLEDSLGVAVRLPPPFAIGLVLSKANK